MRLIDADALLTKCRQMAEIEWNKSVPTTWADAYLALFDIVDELPIVDAVPVVHGRWLWTVIGEEDREQYWRCSVCNDHSYIEYNYCPNCGAKMDLEDKL